MLDKNLEKHPFILLNFEDIEPLLKLKAVENLIHVKETGEIRSSSPMELAPKEYYCMAVFEKSNYLLDSLERLNFAIRLLKRFPSPKTYERQGISRFKWLEYHYSYFVITYVSLYDISLILVNSVFRLGIPDRFCSNSTVRKNIWVKETDVYNYLKMLDEVIQPYRHPRNLYVHRGSSPDIKEKVDYDFMDLIHLIDLINQTSEPIVEREILQNAYDGQTHLLIRNLTKDIENVQNIIIKIFDGLTPMYNKKKSNLSSDYK